MNNDAVIALTLVVKRLMKEVVPDELARARLLDSVQAEIGEKLGVERPRAAFSVIGGLWD